MGKIERPVEEVGIHQHLMQKNGSCITRLYHLVATI